MKSRCIFITLCLLIMILGARVGSAQEIKPLEPEWLRQMYAEGWQKVEEGVLQRDTGGGRFETFGYGAEGLPWLIQSYEQQVQFFEDKYEESPTHELLELIEQLRSKVDSLNVELQAGPSAEPFDGEVLEGCSFSYDATAYAGPQESPQGVTATASAYLHNDCGYVGNTTAYAYAQAIDGTLETYLTRTDPKNSGTWLDSTASASANGSTACESRAQATVDIPQLGIYYAAPPAENYSCPGNVSPVIASVSGPTSVTTDYYTAGGCADVTWTASATGGHPGGYTYNWYIGTDPTIQGTGSTFTKSYCNTSQSVTVKVVARDSDGHTDDETFTTTIQPTDPVVASVSGPATVTTDYYINSGCANVTWTASAIGGHPGGYTYSWYIGTDPTVQGTGSTFTKSYCNTSQAVTVKVVAQDSDGHTDDATYTANIQYIGPLAASISGPASVTTDFYGPTCVNVTWSASATGGHPGYTYSWYLGTSTGTTVQGTGSTFTKSLCSTNQSVTVKVVDSDGHTSNKTFTTSVQYKPAIVVTITGPTSVSSSTSCTTVSWTVSASGTGHSGFSYKWYIGTAQQTTGTTFSKQFCSSGGASQSVTVKATATASDGHQDTDTHTTSITFPTPPTASITGPSELYITTAGGCKNITWTGSATGGTPGYTYSWYIGTSTTVQGTASTLTKSFCGAQTINVKLVVRDAAAQSDDATFTTTIYYEPIESCYSGNIPVPCR